MTHMRVLVVDDDPTVNFVSCEILQDCGCQAVGVHCAAAAFEALDNDAKLSCLVTDIELGGGPDGFAVARRARLANPCLPVVYISGTAAARHRSEGVDRSEFLQKPFQAREFVEVLRRVVSRETGLDEIPTDNSYQEPAAPEVDVRSGTDSNVWL